MMPMQEGILKEPGNSGEGKTNEELIMKNLFVLFLFTGVIIACGSGPGNKADSRATPERYDAVTGEIVDSAIIDLLNNNSSHGEIVVDVDLFKKSTSAMSVKDKKLLYYLIKDDSNHARALEYFANGIWTVNGVGYQVYPEAFIEFTRVDVEDNYYKAKANTPRINMPSGSFYSPGTNSWVFSSYGLPSEASRGGMNQEFVIYDYEVEFDFLARYPWKEYERIIGLFVELGSKIDYNFAKAYGVAGRIRPGQIGGICDDYADIVTDAVSRADIPGLTKVYKVTSSIMNHAWNEFEFNGRTIYADLTWFDINKIGDDGYSISTPQEIGRDWDYKFLTEDIDIFNRGFSGQAYYHYSGRDTKKVLVWSK